MSDIRDRLKRVIVESLRLERAPESIPNNRLREALDIDSVASLELLIWVENEFGITIDDSDLNVGLVDSLDTLEAYVEKRLTGSRNVAS